MEDSDLRIWIEELMLDGKISLAPTGKTATRYFNRMNEIVKREGYPAIEYDNRTGKVWVKR